MTVEKIPTFSGWVPEHREGLRLGPPRWNGRMMITDVGLAGESRLVEIGLIERLVIDSVDGSRGVGQIVGRLAEQGLVVPEAQVVGILNKFAFFGFVERPFLTRSGVEEIDSRAAQGPAMRDDQLARGQRARGPLSLWRRMGWIGQAWISAPVYGLAAIALVLLVLTIPDALSTLRSAPAAQLAFALALGCLWSLLVTLLHENSHAAVFNRLADSAPFLALTRFGIILMPNTHMPGFSLLEPRDKAKVIAIGPAVSLVNSLVPIAVFLTAGDELLRVVAAFCVCLDALIIFLGISPFPNTDATRLLEAVSGVDQIQAVAFRSLIRRYQVPASLPLRTRVAIRIYPVLLAAACLMWLAVVVWVLRLTFQ